ncbi:dTDP-4-dehydrorhamnose reductase [Nitrosomonas sp. Is37]|uniref:dTDP-4-dehydrorhamnose reductase n=1 Tax=Nitrosomonas sp. Is37 TaxID=3080535 RepID=UPI00294AA037|nr:dTDP-4-dehydrorhamnose reductase [Nitrosomonas sp. Is37]MDV6343013.1 dTDP-4-dehydrorhamnose reductase [Nitrosomonas sp. Is37]
MKILLFGKNGQVGWELQRSLQPLGEVVALDRSSQEYCGNLTDLAGIAQTVRAVAPDVIVNAAAYTAVDRAESEPDLAYQINAEAPAILAQEAQRMNAWLVHYSTDYVFDGSGDRPWSESDLPSPLNVYGQTKLQGEEAIRSAGCRHLIFRTSWVYAARGNNFAKTMLRLAQERDQLTIIDDQIGAPTGADLLADATAHAISMALKQPEVAGLYHLVAGGKVSWYGYARFILSFAREHGWAIKTQSEAILPVLSSAFATAAKRPLNSRLDTEKFRCAFRLNIPHWQIGVARMLTEVLEK